MKRNSENATKVAEILASDLRRMAERHHNRYFPEGEMTVDEMVRDPEWRPVLERLLVADQAVLVKREAAEKRRLDAERKLLEEAKAEALRKKKRANKAGLSRAVEHAKELEEEAAGFTPTTVAPEDFAPRSFGQATTKVFDKPEAPTTSAATATDAMPGDSWIPSELTRNPHDLYALRVLVTQDWEAFKKLWAEADPTSLLYKRLETQVVSLASVLKEIDEVFVDTFDITAEAVGEEVANNRHKDHTVGMMRIMQKQVWPGHRTKKLLAYHPDNWPKPTQAEEEGHTKARLHEERTSVLRRDMMDILTLAGVVEVDAKRIISSRLKKWDGEKDAAKVLHTWAKHTKADHPETSAAVLAVLDGKVTDINTKKEAAAEA